MRHVHGGDGLAQRTDLVDLDQQSVGHALLDTLFQDGGIGHEQVVADQLHAVADGVGQQLPPLPVALIQAILNGDDRILAAERGKQIDHAGRIQFAVALAGQHVEAVAVELGGGDVGDQHDILARLQSGLVDRREDGRDPLLIGAQVRGEAALIADGGDMAACLEHRFEGMEHLRPHVERLAERGRAGRGDHVLLEIDAVVGM